MCGNVSEGRDRCTSVLRWATEESDHVTPEYQHDPELLSHIKACFNLMLLETERETEELSLKVPSSSLFQSAQVWCEIHQNIQECFHFHSSNNFWYKT